MQERQEAGVELIKTREDPTVMLDFVHKTLDQGSLPVAPGVVGSGFFPVLAGGNDWDCPLVGDKSKQFIAVVTAIGQDILPDFLAQQALSLGNVVTFTTRQEETQRVAQSIGFDMDFAAKATPTPPQRLGGLSTVFLRPQQRTGERG